MKLTTATIAALSLPAGKTDHIEWDDDLPGFGVRLRGQAKTWVVQYRVGDQQRRESLGDVRQVRLDDARRIARQRFAQAELGTDPVAERKTAAAAALTLATAMTRYLDAKQDTMRPNTYKAAERYFTVHWKPLRERPLTAITRADVAARLQELIKAHGRTSAARARDYLSAMHTWAAKEGLCEGNPVFLTNDPAAGIPPRDRVLSDDEIRTVWSVCGDDSTGRIVKLLLLTGCRREEIGALRWSEVNLDSGLLTIPGARTKNKRTLELPLPAVAVAILKSVPNREQREFVFGRKDGPFAGWAAAKLQIDASIVIATGKTLPGWTFHDLRRTMRTGLGKIGVAPHIAELCINHVKGGVQAIYDKHRYQREIGAALGAWSGHVLALAEGRADKVVPLRA
jgi:integrase